MDEQFHIQISGLTKKEYIQAGSESIRRMALPLLGLVAVLTIVIGLAIGDFSLRSILPPFAIGAVFLLILQASVALSWRKFPSGVAFSYLIDSDGWEITVGEDRANIDWQDTARMTVRSHVVLLYNEANRSNTIPRRCLTGAQLEQLKAWYRDSRKAHKARQKEKDEEFRRDFRTRRMAERLERRNRRRP